MCSALSTSVNLIQWKLTKMWANPPEPSLRVTASAVNYTDFILQEWPTAGSTEQNEHSRCATSKHTQSIHTCNAFDPISSKNTIFTLNFKYIKQANVGSPFKGFFIFKGHYLRKEQGIFTVVKKLYVSETKHYLQCEQLERKKEWGKSGNSLESFQIVTFYI